MTSATYERDGNIGHCEEIYDMREEAINAHLVPKHKVKVKPLSEIIKLQVVRKKEEEMVEAIESKGGKVLSIKSEGLSKRRYKRRMAKLLKRAAKHL